MGRWVASDSDLTEGESGLRAGHLIDQLPEAVCLSRLSSDRWIRKQAVYPAVAIDVTDKIVGKGAAKEQENCIPNSSLRESAWQAPCGIRPCRREHATFRRRA